ncbi:hypothetical protein OG373_21435 [Streptomyces avidinii]|uniref:hypothetical protein n=1 Tax=Streptomyces avidinii TaxID=1895 RepID=UPI00386B639E|nr:hypothetical protein OG373_21435 [Streptomyces avidinii]
MLPDREASSLAAWLAERAVAQHCRCLRALVPAVPEPEPEPAPEEEPPGSPWPNGQRFADCTRARHAAVHALLESEHSRRSIQRQLAMTWRTVTQLAEAAVPEELCTGQWQNRPSVLDDYKPYLDDRWNEGFTNAWSATKAATSASVPTRTEAHLTATGDRPATVAPNGFQMDPQPPRGPNRARTTPAQDRPHPLS